MLLSHHSFPVLWLVALPPKLEEKKFRCMFDTCPFGRALTPDLPMGPHAELEDDPDEPPGNKSFHLDAQPFQTPSPLDSVPRSHAWDLLPCALQIHSIHFLICHSGHHHSEACSVTL